MSPFLEFLFCEAFSVDCCKLIIVKNQILCPFRVIYVLSTFLSKILAVAELFFNVKMIVKVFVTFFVTFIKNIYCCGNSCSMSFAPKNLNICNCSLFVTW